MRKLKILTWNLGFGAMGTEAEIAMNGGKKFIPSSSAQVLKNIIGIQKIIQDQNADIFLLQEVSYGSLLNHWHNLEQRLRDVLNDFHAKFVPNFKFPLPFRFLRNEHGLETYISPDLKIINTETHRYKKSERYYGLVKRRDSFLIVNLLTNTGETIVVINTHLATFDKEGVIRKKQCSELLKYAECLYKKGQHVIIGADWNMLLIDKFIDSISKERSKKYLCYFPTELLPKNWNISFCDSTPTVRASGKPYNKDNSTTATIDGFVCSPGISVESVKTINFDFKYSDHNPVEIVISY